MAARLIVNENQMVIAVDHTGTWYRHPRDLLRDLLRLEAAREVPSLRSNCYTNELPHGSSCKAPTGLRSPTGSLPVTSKKQPESFGSTDPGCSPRVRLRHCEDCSCSSATWRAP